MKGNNKVGEDSGHEIELLLGGVIPEREREMREYLGKYAPIFFRCDDRPGFFIEAGPYGILKFTQRTMHQMWILGFAANQALNSYSSALAILRLNSENLDTNTIAQIPGQEQEDNKYANIIDSVYKLAKVSRPSEFDWPSTVPIPNKKPTDMVGAATFDLICMAGAYVILHEMKHIAFSIDGTAPANTHEEEHACDLFAKSMMLSEIEAYSRQSGYDLSRLKSKRAISISLALFFMLVITPQKSWAGTETHPSIKSRIESLVNDLSIHDDDILWVYMASLLLAHLQYMGDQHIVCNFVSLKDLTINLISRIEKASNKAD